MKNIANKWMKVLGFILAGIGYNTYRFQIAYATTDYAKNAVTAISNELVWVAIGATALAIIKCFVSRAYSMAVVSVLVGGVTSYVLANPGIIQTVGEKFGSFLK